MKNSLFKFINSLNEGQRIKQKFQNMIMAPMLDNMLQNTQFKVIFWCESPLSLLWWVLSQCVHPPGFLSCSGTSPFCKTDDEQLDEVEIIHNQCLTFLSLISCRFPLTLSTFHHMNLLIWTVAPAELSPKYKQTPDLDAQRRKDGHYFLTLLSTFSSLFTFFAWYSLNFLHME